MYPIIKPSFPSYILLAAYKDIVLFTRVIITDHHPSSKKGKYMLEEIEGCELGSGINFKVASLFKGSGIDPEYDPLVYPDPVFSVLSLPPNSLICKIVSGIPKILISDLKPAFVPFFFNK